MNRPRKHLVWIASTLAVLSIGAGLAWRTMVIRRDIERWETYQRNCQAAGEDLSVASWQPPEVAQEDNLMTHPWLVEFLASESSEAAKAVRSLQPEHGLGLNDYESPEEGQSWLDGRETEANQVLAAGRAQARHLAAIHEAAGRPGCRAPVNFNQFYSATTGLNSRITRLAAVLAAQADAAIAQGDEVTATEHLVAMFQLGNHLRSQNFLIASVFGAGFEKSAHAVTQTGVSRTGMVSPRP